MIKNAIVFLLILFCAACGYAFDGYDSDSGDRVSIQGEDSIPDEGEVDYYDYKADTFKHDTINSDLGEGEGPIDVYDAQSGVSRSLDTD